jgi:uridine kinase
MVKAAGSFAEFAKNYDLDVPQALELELMCSHIKELLNGNSVYLPKYDMSGTAKRYDNNTLAKPSKIIISEGLFTLTDKIKSAFDFKIYVDVAPEVQKERFFIRAAERDLGESANGIYKNASQKADIYIRPCKQDADIVLSGEAVRARYKSFLNKLINIVQQENFKNKIIV